MVLDEATVLAEAVMVLQAAPEVLVPVGAALEQVPRPAVTVQEKKTAPPDWALAVQVARSASRKRP